MYKGNLVRCEMNDNIAILTIDNPPMNPLCQEVMSDIRNCINMLEESDDVRCLIITGGGDKAFVAGADIKEFPNWTPDICEDLTRKGQAVFCMVENFKAPVIAAINGFALGGGLELALCCDIRLASEKARMGLPEATLGIIPGYGGTQRLCKTINVGDAKKMMFTGEMIRADKALQLGLVQDVYAPEELMDKAIELAKKIAENGPLAVSEIKKCANYERGRWINQGLTTELASGRFVFTTDDHTEGINAFIEKREATFTNK